MGWQSIWRLEVPPKVEVFFWRACSKALVSRENLHRRLQLQDTEYGQCGYGVESDFFTCYLSVSMRRRCRIQLVLIWLISFKTVIYDRMLSISIDHRRGGGIC